MILTQNKNSLQRYAVSLNCFKRFLMPFAHPHFYHPRILFNFNIHVIVSEYSQWQNVLTFNKLFGMVRGLFISFKSFQEVVERLTIPHCPIYFYEFTFAKISLKFITKISFPDLKTLLNVRHREPWQ